MNPEEVWAAERSRLVGLAYRILGSRHDAEDVVSQAWMRFAQQVDVQRPQAWLTTVTTRLAIDESRRRRTRREEYVGPWLPEPVATEQLPEHVAETRSLLGLGVLRMMEDLPPEDRAIFVLREAFDVPYADIADCVGRSAAACRQVVSRARARWAGSADAASDGGGDVDRRLLTAILGAVSTGDIASTVRLVSGDCVLWTDAGGTSRAALHPIHGAEKVARFLHGVAQGATGMQVEFIDVNGRTALWLLADGVERVVALEHDGTTVTGIQIHANPAKLAHAR